MVFSSTTFLFFFLPLLCALYFVLPGRKWRNGVLLGGSLLFYSWGEPKFVFLMLGATLVAWLAGLAMDRFENKKRLFAAAATVILIGDLLFFKYMNFFAENVSAIFGVENRLPDIVLPVGISFFTFQILSYVLDLCRGEVAVQKSFPRLLLYVCLFPQLIAGPIVRYQTVEQEIGRRNENLEDVFLGLGRFLLGLAKKLLIANNVAKVCESIYAGDPETFGTAMYWVAAVAYSLQIYFDFSGYSDMAIGLGRIFGFHFLENFDYPYLACSVTEFWRRWHISLSSWFRDYVYIPLGGNRVGKGRWMLNILIVWGLTGFWHGANWNFLLWGLYYGILLMIEKLATGSLMKKLPKALSWFITMVIVATGWVLFNNTDMTVLGRAIGRMFTVVPTDWAGVVSAADLLKSMLYLPLGFVFAIPFWRRKAFEFYSDHKLSGTLCAAALYAILFILCDAYVLSSSFNPFIYFRF